MASPLLVLDTLASPIGISVESAKTESRPATTASKFSGSGETDVVWFDANLPGSTRGKAPYEDYDNGYCDQYYVTFDPAQINVGSNDDADTDKTVCHELGHTVGLTHGSGGGDGGADDCMISGERPSTNSQYERYSNHHKGHINAWF